VFDPADTLACARLVAGLADLGAGRAVCHPTPNDPSGTWLAVDLLVALGKRLDAPLLERISHRAWPLAEVWLRAEPIRDLFVLRAHLLSPRALGRLVALRQRCGLRLWLIVHRPALRPAQQRTLELDAATWCAIDLPAFSSRWPASTDQPDPSGPPGPAATGRAYGDADGAADGSGFPAVPGADFPVFRATCRRLLDPDSFTEVDRCYCDTMRRLLAWLADHSELLHTMDRCDPQAVRRAAIWHDTAWAEADDDPGVRTARAHARRSLAQVWDHFTTRAAEQLFAVTAADRTPTETLVRFRAAQAAFLRHGLLLTLDPTMLAMLGPGDDRARLHPQAAMRLRGCCTPRCAAAATLTLATRADTVQLARLRIGDLTGDGATVHLDGTTVAIPTHARSLLRALLIERGDQHATTDAPLFADQAGRVSQPHTLHGLLEQAARQAGVAIPRINSHHRSAAWLAEHGLTMTRLPVPPLDLALR